MKSLPLLILAASAAGCAPSPAGPKLEQPSYRYGECFRTDSVINSNITDARTAYVATNRGYVYRLSTPSDCFGTDTVNISLVQFQRAGGVQCIGDITAVRAAQWRSGAELCQARISGPERDSAVSGLRSRRN